MKRLLSVATCVAVVVAAGAAAAQSTSNNYGGTPPWTFRTENERIARTNQTNTVQSVKRGGVFGATSSSAGGSGWGASSTAVSNHFSVTNNVSCYSASGSVGSPVSCSGGTNVVSGTNQTTTDSTVGADTSLTGNTITTTTNNSKNGVAQNNGSVGNN